MPADPIPPDKLDGQQRFRADLVAYLDSGTTGCSSAAGATTSTPAS
jgi:hypothetical protein